MFKKILLLLLVFYISLPILATDNSKEKKALAKELQKNKTQLAKKKAEQKQTKKSLSYLKRELYIENKKLASTKRKLKYSIHKSKKLKKTQTNQIRITKK